MPQHLVDSIKDPKFWSNLEAFTKMGELVMPHVASASQKSGQTGASVIVERVRAKVDAL